MIMLCRIFVAALAALAALGLAPQSGWSQSYPDHPIRLIVPFAAGGNADINGRIVGDIVHKALGQPVVVENRAGAGGGVGAEHVARAAPDGYTLLVGSNGPLTINPIVNPISYDPLNDFTAVALVSYVPHVLVTSNKLEVKTIADLVALSKTRPVNLATSGVGSATHMTLERFKHATGAQIAHVPYKSGGSLLPERHQREHRRRHDRAVDRSRAAQGRPGPHHRRLWRDPLEGRTGTSRPSTSRASRASWRAASSASSPLRRRRASTSPSSRRRLPRGSRPAARPPASSSPRAPRWPRPSK